MYDQKADIVNVRVPPEMRMILDEIAEATGMPCSGIVRICVDKAMSMMYDSDGYLMDAGKISSGSINKLDGFFLLNDVSKAYGIPYNTIWFAIKSGRVRSARIDRKTYVKLSDVLKRKG